MSIIIRPFYPSDQDYYISRSRDFYASRAVDHQVDPSHFIQTFDYALTENPYLQGLILEHNGVRAGFALLSFSYSNEAGGIVILLDEAYIDPEHRSKGLGSQLFSWVEEQYVKTGKAKRLRLEVTESNQDAVRLYQKIGFQPLEYLQMIKDF